MRGCNQLLPIVRKRSTISMLNLVIHPSQSPEPLLRPWVFQSPVHSNHPKIVHWVKPNSKQLARRLERLFFNIISPSFGGKKHWLLVVDDSSYYTWRFFLKEKYNLVDIMIGIIKNLKNQYNLQVQNLCCDNA